METVQFVKDRQSRFGKRLAALPSLTTNLGFDAFLSMGIDMLLEGGTFESAPESTIRYAEEMQSLLTSPDPLDRTQARVSLVEASSDPALRELITGAIDEALSDRRVVARFPGNVVTKASEISSLLSDAAAPGQLEQQKPFSIAKGPGAHDRDAAAAALSRGREQGR